MTVLLQDFRYALRQLRQSPGFALTAILTLALGIGANTAIFSLVHAMLLRSLPVSNPAQLYRIGDTADCCVDGGFPGDASDTGDYSIFSYDLYQHLRNSAPEFEQLAAVQAGRDPWSVRRGSALSKPLTGEFVSGNYFSTLGIGAYAGRVLGENDDTPASAPATVLSYKTWQGEYASDPSIVGSTIFIQAKPFTVVGIAPSGFFGDRLSDNPPDLWVPIQTEPYLHGDSAILHHAESNWLYPLGRVRPGTNIGALQTKLSVALRQWLFTRPILTANGGAAIIPKMHVVIAPGGGGIQQLQSYVGDGLKMLMILSSVVLLIACANIANLMLARATTRRADVAVRMALGAGRRRVVRQILTESVLLSIFGGLGGCLCRNAHHPLPRLPRGPQYAHRCHPLPACARVRLPRLASHRHFLRRRTLVAVVSRATGRSAARRQPFHPRPLFSPAKSPRRLPGGLVARAHRGSHSDDQVPHQSGAPEPRHCHLQPLRVAFRPGRRGVHH